MPRIEGTSLGVGPDGALIFAPVVVVRIQVGLALADTPAIVDSGADRTVIPAQLAQALGVQFNGLPDGGTSKGAGGTFETRPCIGLVKFREWAVCEEFLVAGPTAGLPAVLLGRNDFFRRFVVRFQWHRDPPFFDVDPAPNVTKVNAPGRRRTAHPANGAATGERSRGQGVG